MTAEWWATAAGWAREILMTAVMVLVWVFGRERKLIDVQMAADRQAVRARFLQLRAEIERIPTMEQLRQTFVATVRMTDLLRESHGEHAEIWAEIRRLRDLVERGTRRDD